MSQEPKPEFPDLLYAMDSPCGIGHKGEFKNAAGKTISDLTHANESLFNLRSGDAEFHGWSHTLCALAALIDPKTESMKRFVYAPQYQGDIDGEFMVRAVHRCLIGIREQRSPFGHKVDITREVIRGFIQENFEKEPHRDNWAGRRENGHKAAFSLARRFNCTLFELRRKFGFEDDQIAYMADSQAWDHKWRDSIRPPNPYSSGSHFFVERRVRSRLGLVNSERQTYRDIINVKDEGYTIMIDRIAGVIDHFQDVIWGAESEESVTKNLTGADVLNAFLRTNEIPNNPYFEQQFGL